MVSCLSPHWSLNILLCSYSYLSSVGYFIVFIFLFLFRGFFCCVLIPVCLPSIPRIIPLLTTLLVPSLIVGYRPTPPLINVANIYCYLSHHIYPQKIFSGETPFHNQQPWPPYPPRPDLTLSLTDPTPYQHTPPFKTVVDRVQTKMSTFLHVLLFDTTKKL